MPERLSYDEAMLLARARLKIADPELKQGEVEKVTIPTRAGSVTIPWGIEGGFAVVYKYRTQSGQHRALRCFRVPMNQDTQIRYERIGPYFHAHASDITANFKYHDAGITVKESGKPNQTYPVIEMDWIDGVTLLAKVDELCTQRDRAALKNLGEQWLGIIKTMRLANMAHGDLAGVNVMVRADGRLVLIDYDGVYIPDFAGMPQLVLGQEDYQHAQMKQRQFNEHMDDFSALVIYTALLALEVRPELWDKYVKRDLQGKLLENNLLFNQQDFRDPRQSALMTELEQSRDPRVRAAAQELKRLSLGAIDQVRFPFQLIDPDYDKKLALEKLVLALKTNDDELIAASWPTTILDSYAPAQPHRRRVQEAEKRVQALQRLHRAIQGHNIQQIVNTYDAILDGCSNVTQDERLLLATARRFIQAYLADNDEELLKTATILQSIQALKGMAFTTQEQQRIALARQRILALQQLRDALKSRSIEATARAYQPGQNIYRGLSHDEQKQAEMARDFMQEYHTDDDAVIIAACDTIQNSSYHSFFVYTAQQQQRIALARKRTEALVMFRVALASKSPRRIVTAYDPVLDSSKQVTQDQRDRYGLAHNFIQAYDADDDVALVAAYDAILTSTYRAFFTFSAEEEQGIAHARRYNQALLKFRDALKSKRPYEITTAYDPILDSSKHVTQDERYQLILAHNFVQAYADDDDEAIVASTNAMQSHSRFIFTPQEQQRIALAIKRQAALATFQKAWRDDFRNAQRLVAAYDASLLDDNKQVTTEQRKRVEAARMYLEMLRGIRAAISVDNEGLVRNIYNKTIDQEFEGFTPLERNFINRMVKSLELQEILRNREYARAILMARNLVRTSEKAIRDNLFQLHLATKRFIREHDLSELHVHIAEIGATGVNEAIASWHWPHVDLVRDAIIVWRNDTWPQRPQERSWQDPEWHFIEVHRQGHHATGECRFSIERNTHIYVQAFACICDDWEPGHMQWRYSDGSEPTSRAEARNSGIIWRHYG